MINQMKKENKWRLILILGIILCFGLLCIVSSASAYTEKLEYGPQLKNYYMLNTYSSGGSRTAGLISVNYSALTNPTDYICEWYASSPIYTGAGTFTIYDGTTQIAGGTVSILNGSFAGGYNEQMWLSFNYFNKGTKTGIKQCSIIFSGINDASFPFYYSGSSTYDSGQVAINYLYSSGNYLKGYHITNDQIYARNDVSISLEKGITNITINKNPIGTPYSSLITIFANNAVAYSELSENTNNLNNKGLYTFPVIVQSRMLGYYVNSSPYSGGGDYFTTIAPSSINVNQTVTLMLNSYSDMSLAQLNNIIVSSSYNSGVDTVHKYMIPINGYSSQIIEYQKLSNGTWQHFVDNVGFTGNDGKTTPNSMQFALPVSGNWTITTNLLTDNGDEYNIINNLNVNGDIGNIVFGVYPVDAITGNFLTGQLVSLYDQKKKIWTNVTSDTVTNCNFLVNKGNFVWVVTGTGAYSGHIYSGNDYIDSDYAENVPMQRNDLISSTNGTVIFYVVNQNLQPISGAYISIPTLNQGKSTGSSGTITFYTPFDTDYSYSITAGGYQGISGSFKVTNATTPLYISKMLNTQSIVTYVTTSTPTPTPTINQTIGASVCKMQLGANATYFDMLKNWIACQGITTKDGQNFLLGIFLILICMAVGANYAKGMGAILGTVIGYIACIGLNILPIWTLYALIVICGLIFGINLYNKQKTG